MSHAPEAIVEWQADSLTKDAIKRLHDLRAAAYEELLGAGRRSGDAKVCSAAGKIDWLDELIKEFESGEF